jgi:protein-S-isoprenylcysteine O-methyltransferase Ste14
MHASVVEFRLRILIVTVIISLGFWAPWVQFGHIGTRMSLLEWLALSLARAGVLSFAAAIHVAIGLAITVAAVAAVMRVWGTAYLGESIVNHARMQAGTVMAAGPYRYVRNPLYVGAWFMVAAMAFLMPASGALVCMVLLSVFLTRLIFGEEAFLAGELGEPYNAYRAAVPRLIPRLRSPLPRLQTRPSWLRSVLAELNPIGVLLTFVCLSWRFDIWLMTRTVIVTFGVSLVVRALLPPARDGQS